jgi:hypothetical protein
MRHSKLNRYPFALASLETFQLPIHYNRYHRIEFESI